MSDRERLVSAELAFATPRKLPKASAVRGRVVVLDIAFASEASGGGFEKITRPFIDGLGTRLAAWIDHHDHALHAQYKDDPRFVLATKAEHGACPEMVTEALCDRVGAVDTIVCHTDFDGLCSAAKWMRGGREPYAGADDDARAVDTRIGTPSPIAQRIDRAIRGRGRDVGLLGLIVRHLATGLSDASLWIPIDEAGGEAAAKERAAAELARGYRRLDLEKPPFPKCTSVAFLDVSRRPPGVIYDRTALLMAGQARASMALLVDGENLTLAAPFDSGINFLALLGLSGGMPTLVSIHSHKLGEVLKRLGVSRADVDLLT